MSIQINRLTHNEKVPFELLLQADPSEEMINRYLPESDVYVARQNNEIVGVFVLMAASEDEMEIKNISVDNKFQRQGIGKEMVKQAIRVAKMEGFLFLTAKTADTSLGNHQFYKKMKFEEYYRVKGHFMKYYEQPIIENGVEAIDQIAFRRPI
ncbi:MAG: GNAT family N-acetyltransferase [Cyclobacteriaceae bacterium]